MTTRTHDSIHTAADEAYSHQECVFCFDPLHYREVSFLIDRAGSKVCDHYFHTECIKSYERTKIGSRPQCPLCRKDFKNSRVVPPVEVNPRAWFDFMDVNKDGSLSYEEIVIGLKAQLPLDWAQIETHVDRQWYRWDKDRNGSISYDEFADEETGVLAFLKATYPKNPRPEPPNLVENYNAWFEYWDEDHNGTLDKAEITRALIKTFRMYNFDKAHVEKIVDNIWPVFDSDGSGVIEKDEFSAQNNFGDTISAQIFHELRSIVV